VLCTSMSLVGVDAYKIETERETAVKFRRMFKCSSVGCPLMKQLCKQQAACCLLEVERSRH